MSERPRNIHRQREAGHAVTDFGAVLLAHYQRTCRNREEALEEAFAALLGQVRTLAHASRFVEATVRERTELLRAAERRARGEPARQPLDEAGLL